MRVLRALVIILLIVMITLLTGQLLVSKGIKVKEVHKHVIKYVKGYGKQDESDLSVETVDIINEGYENGKYTIYVLERLEDREDINHIIQKRMRLYYMLVTTALDREKRKYEGSKEVQILIGDRDWSIGFEYSYDRKESLEWHVGRMFFLEHTRFKGWDVLNNSDGFWMDKELNKGIKGDIRERIDWRKYREE